MEKKKKPALSKKEAKLKAGNFCAYQERSQKEVRNKLYDYGLYREEVEEVLSELITDGYVNEERFARSYAGGKFRVKKWGKNRIKMGLQQHEISDYCVSSGLNEIEDADYFLVLEELIEKKSNSLSETNLFIKRDKIAKHLIFKGYEPEYVWKSVKEIVQ